MVTKKPTKRKPTRARSREAKPEEISLWERLAKIGESVPMEEWEKLPRDLSKNFDHYAHGSPREE